MKETEAFLANLAASCVPHGRRAEGEKASVQCRSGVEREWFVRTTPFCGGEQEEGVGGAQQDALGGDRGPTGCTTRQWAVFVMRSGTGCWLCIR